MANEMRMPCTLMEGVPGEDTVGWVGMLIMDIASANGDIYKCIGILDGRYIWRAIETGGGGGGGQNGITPHIGENGNWFLGEEDTGVKAQGEDGKNGERGTGILKVTTSPSSYNFTIDGVTTSYRIPESNVTTESGITNVLVGDTILYSYYLYKVVLVDTLYVYLGTRTTIRGATGAAGSAGAAGERGTGILPITTEPTSSLLVVGNFTSTYNISLSTVLSQAGVTKVLVGDILEYNSYHYTVGYVDTSKVYSNTRKSIKGDKGAAGANGYTPQKGTDYYTEEDKDEMVQSVLAALPTWEGGNY